MQFFSGHVGVGDRPVVYAGRSAGRVAKADLPGGCEVLGETEAASRLAAAMKEATALILLDPSSFPFEAMSEDHRDVPLIVVLPPELDAEALTAAFGTSLFEHLGFFDRLVSSNADVWRDLRGRYRWAETQRLEAGTVDPVKLAASLCASRGEICRDRQGSNKAVYRARTQALDRRFAVASEGHPGDAPLEVLGVGDGIWAATPELSEARFQGIGVHENVVESVRREFPELGFERLGPDLRFPHRDRSFDLVFGVDVFQDESPPVRNTLLSEMWRVARPGGRLLFLEDFVFERAAEREDPMPVFRFMDLTLEATDNQVVLDHVESLRYPGDDLFRGGVISLLRLGTTI